MALFLLLPSAALACSFAIGPPFPTNFGAVKNADSVVLATITQPPGSAPAWADLQINVVKNLAGEAPSGHIYHGKSSCDHSNYAPGQTVVLLLSKDQTMDRWRANGLIDFWTRDPAPDWLSIVEHYLRIDQLDDPVAEFAAMRALRVEEQQSATPIPGLLADIDSFLSAASEHKPFEENLRLFDESTTTLAHGQVPWVFARTRDSRALLFFAELMRDDHWLEHEQAVISYFSAMQDRRYIDRFVERLDVAESRLDYEGLASLTDLLLPDDLPEVVQKLPGLVARLDRGQLGPIGGWLVRHAVPQIIPQLKALVDDDYIEHSMDYLPHALAAAGDPTVLEWARTFLADPYRPYDEPSLPEQIVACSPLPQADELLHHYLVRRHEQHQKQLNGFVEAYSLYYPCPMNWDRLALLSKANLRDDTRDTLARIVLEQLREDPQTKNVMYDWFGPPAWLLLAIAAPKKNP